VTDKPATVEESEGAVSPNTPYLRRMNRREFLNLLKGLGIGMAAGAFLVDEFMAHSAPVVQAAEGETDSKQPYWAMVIDLETCIGCNRCVYACQATNDTATGHLWNILVDEKQDNMSGSQLSRSVFLTRPCMHCEHAPCVEVCPVQATYHRPDGLVTIDYDKCIGCRYCMVACPYGVRVFNWQENTATNPQAPTWGSPEVARRPRGVVEKCTFCAHRLDAAKERGLRPGFDPGGTPACCNICPVKARVFGDLRDPRSPASLAMEGRQVVVLRANLGTKPRVFYLLPR
jgi:molybdopterin-containing oxidoreductase family iron-sulfur binding subunit